MSEREVGEASLAHKQRRQAAALHMVRGGWAASSQGCLPGVAVLRPYEETATAGLMGGGVPSIYTGHGVLCPYEETAIARLMGGGEANSGASGCAGRAVRGCKLFN
jgi:hypothetical protein